LEKHITLKGTNDGYFLFLNEASSLDEIKEDLTKLFEHLKKDTAYEQEYELTIDSGNRILKEKVKKSLSESIHENTNFTIKGFIEDVIDKELAESWHKETSPLMMVRNIRNGQVIHSQRDIILIGDIRPGGLVRSAGSVIVIGNVQGTIHAGSKGNEDAVIIAPFMYNGQVRISEHVEIIEHEEDDEDGSNRSEKSQIVFLNDLHVIEFADVSELVQIRPEFAKDVGGFEEWQKQL
jgi:septum site-determining protein MinC